MENKYITMHKNIKFFVKKGFCPLCGSNVVSYDKEVCLDCEKDQSVNEADYKSYLNEIEQIRKLSSLCNWKEAP